MRLSAGIGVLLALVVSGVASAQPAPLIVVYGPEAPTREGDPDHVERIFLSVPADLTDRLYLRVFDPEPVGAHDTRYGRSTDASTTLFRLSGGEGALQRRARAGRGWTTAPRPPPTRPMRASPAAASSPSAASTRPARPTTPG